MYHPDDCLMISGLQHFRFCRRQWALIHIEQQWAENVRTVEGNFLHERAHNEQLRESRGDLLIVRGLRVQSLTLGLTGQCDVVEFRRDDAHGVPLAGKHGLWLPYPVEYKRGAPKQDTPRPASALETGDRRYRHICCCADFLPFYCLQLLHQAYP